MQGLVQIGFRGIDALVQPSAEPRRRLVRRVRDAIDPVGRAVQAVGHTFIQARHGLRHGFFQQTGLAGQDLAQLRDPAFAAVGEARHFQGLAFESVFQPRRDPLHLFLQGPGYGGRVLAGIVGRVGQGPDTAVQGIPRAAAVFFRLRRRLGQPVGIAVEHIADGPDFLGRPF